MRLKSTQRKSLATVPTNYQGQERRFAQSVSESLDVLTGRRGDVIDRAVTFRDLIDTGVLKLVKGLGTGSGGGTIINPNDNPDGGPTQLPTQPENFNATGGFNIIFLNWTLPPYNGHDYVEIYRLQKTGAAVPTLAQAEASGVYTRYYGDLYQFADTNVGSQENWYYWIRAVNIDGITGPFYSTDGVDATTALDYLFISGLIDDILDDDVNGLGLNTTIDALDLNITQLENFTGYTSGYNGDSLVTRIGDVETVAGNAATSAQLQSEQTARANADSALAADITTLNATVYDTSTGLPATYSGLQSEISTRASADSALATRATALEATVNDSNTGVAATYSGLQSEITARANADSALSSSITSLTTTVNGNTASIQTNTSSINGVEAKYSVKVDNNGHVSGFGLISTANNGTVTSSFIVAADRFAIARPFNSSNTNVSTNYPFKVVTNNSTYADDGTPIPQGVYIEDAFIHNSQITNALIGDATITSAKIFDLSATRISSGNIAIDNSNSIAIFQGKRTYSYYDSDLQKSIYVPNFNSTASGFVLGNNNNNAFFHMGVGSSSYLKFDGATGRIEATGITIKAQDGTTLLRSGGLTNGGSNLVYNNTFTIGVPTLNSTSGSWSVSTTDSDGWEEYSSPASGIERPAQHYIRAGGSYQGYSSYFRSTSQRFPVTGGETIYLSAQTSVLSGVWLGLAFYNNQDGENTSGSSTTRSVSNTAGTIDSDIRIGIGNADRHFCVGAVTVPTGYDFAEMRFGSDNGNQIYFYEVGASRVPTEISADYASTYIRNLAVDTLQIADNAVTVPLVKEYPAYPTSGYLTHASEGVERELSTSANQFAVRFDNLGSGAVPDKVAVMVFFELVAATTGGDWAAATLRIRSSSSSASWPTGGIVEQALQVNDRKGSAPEFSLTFLMDGWTGTKYFWPTISITKEQSGTTSGWWKLQEGNIVILGARK